MSKRSSNQAFYVGVDIENIARFRALNRIRHRRFLERIFTVQELRYCFSKKDPAPHLAVRFCAKEAVIKALAGLGIHKISHRIIGIANTTKGVPKVRLHSRQKMPKVVVSLSHTISHAIAFVIVFYV